MWTASPIAARFSRTALLFWNRIQKIQDFSSSVHLGLER